MSTEIAETPHCYSCGAPLILPSGTVSRSESCDRCRNDVHVCKNCVHYDTSAYNECREPSAERVVDKEKRNFCDYFSIRKGTAGSGSGGSSRDEMLKKLNDLFKK